MVNLVDAIENGRIVKVTDDYARREGLLIIRKQNDAAVSQVSDKPVLTTKSEDRRLRKDFTLDKMRKPLGYYKNNVIADLVDNFHWEIVNARKIKNMTRKQLAQAMNESEEAIKMVENGILQSDNYILINKIQSYLGINLRKDGRSFTAPVVKKAEQPKPEVEIEDADAGEKVSSGDIEVFGED